MKVLSIRFPSDLLDKLDLKSMNLDVERATLIREYLELGMRLTEQCEAADVEPENVIKNISKSNSIEAKDFMASLESVLILREVAESLLKKSPEEMLSLKKRVGQIAKEIFTGRASKNTSTPIETE